MIETEPTKISPGQALAQELAGKMELSRTEYKGSQVYQSEWQRNFYMSTLAMEHFKLGEYNIALQRAFSITEEGMREYTYLLLFQGFMEKFH
ncbi:MAG: hypothetical protein ACYDBX_02685 [Patescibacteria group bacterium]